jgi:hypothetical protein
MFNALYPEDTDAAIDAQMRRPSAAPAPVPWFRGAWRAIGQAVPRAGAEMGRTGTALLTPEAVGAMDAPTMFSAPGKTSKPQLADEIREQDRALADSIKEFTPDPNTTGAASMVLHDVTKFVGKAAAYSALGGTPLAVTGMAVDEGTNEALRRMDEGVDAATAAKLGVTKGIASGVAVALPVAGKTLAQTLGLAAFGGPGSYIAEQTVAKHILENAGYDEQAAQVDPFDPLGLGVSFFGSLFFGAGVHGARRVKARSDARAADERMLADSRPPGEPTQVAQAVARAYTPEQVDAAHVSVLQAQREGSALHAREDIAAAGRHAEALDRASEQLAAGQRVSVGDLAPGPALPFDTPAARAMLDQIDALMAERAELLPMAGQLAERGDVAAVRAELEQLQAARPPEGAQAEREIAKEIQAQERVSYKAALSEAKKQLADRLTDFEAKVQRLEGAIESNARGQQAEERIAQIDRELTTLEGDAPQARLSRFQRAMADAVVQLQRETPAPRAETAPPEAAAPARVAEAPAAKADPIAEAVTAAARAIETAAKPAEPAQAKSADAAAEPGAEFAAAEADTIAATDPDMLVMMEGMDAPVRAADLLAEAKAMEAQELADAPLLRVAAECALRG